MFKLLKRLIKNFCLGLQLLDVGSKFILNSSNQALRAKTVDVGRLTLLAVAKLLIMADMVDANLILRQAEKANF